MSKFNIWDQDTGWNTEDSKFYRFLAKLKGTDFYFVTDYYKSKDDVERIVLDSEVIHKIEETGKEIQR